MKIRDRLKKIITILILLFTACAALALLGFFIIQLNMREFYHVQYVTTTYQMEIRKDIQTLNKRLLWAIICEDPEVTATQKEELEKRIVKINGYLSTIHDNLRDKEANNDLAKAFQAFSDGGLQMLSLVEKGEAKQAVEYYQTTFNDTSETLADALDEVGTQADQASKRQYQTSQVVWLSFSLLLLLGLGAAILIAKKREQELYAQIVAPLEQLEKAASEIAAGSLHTEINIQSRDEIGQVADALRISLERIASYITEIDRMLESMSQGKLQLNFDNHFTGDFQNIGVSMKRFAASMSQNLSEIEGVSRLVSHGAGQIADSARTLAVGSTEQADEIESTVQTVNSVSQKIADNANEASSLSEYVSLVSNHIKEGNDKMKEVVASMDTISETTEKIRKIIDSIDNIASQTNLLALNASIEAARAGESGRGFAVVANEVSALASQSAQAARNSNQYIEASLQAVDEGKKLADATAAQLNQIVDAVTSITERLNDIAAASNTQSAEVRQVDHVMGKITKIVEQNAAMAQESSASSEELATEAHNLQTLLARFELQ